MNKYLEIFLLKRICPMQKCPICKGTGHEIVDGIKQVCAVCKGAKIIPMYIIKDEKEIEPQIKEKTLLNKKRC